MPFGFYDSELRLPNSWSCSQVHTSSRQVGVGFWQLMTSLPHFLLSHFTANTSALLCHTLHLLPSSQPLGRFHHCPGADLDCHGFWRNMQRRVFTVRIRSISSADPSTSCTPELPVGAQRILAELSDILAQNKGCGFYFSFHSLLRMNIKPCTQHKYWNICRHI